MTKIFTKLRALVDEALSDSDTTVKKVSPVQQVPLEQDLFDHRLLSIEEDVVNRMLRAALRNHKFFYSITFEFEPNNQIFLSIITKWGNVITAEFTLEDLWFDDYSSSFAIRLDTENLDTGGFILNSILHLLGNWFLSLFGIFFNLTGRLNRLQFIICFIVLMILFHIVHYIDDVFLDFVVSLPAYWFTRVVIWILLASLFPLSCILFGRRIHDIGFNAWAGILWSVIIIFINTYSAVSPFNYLLELFVWLIGFLFWVLPGQPEPNQYGNPPFMPVNRPTYESMQPSISHREKEIRKTVRKRRKKR